MGASASVDVKAELAKPADGSDLHGEDELRNEVVRLRKLMKDADEVKKSGNVHDAAALPPELASYTEPKLNLTDVAEPLLPLQQQLEAAVDVDEAPLLQKMRAGQEALQLAIAKELLSQLGGAQACIDPAPLSSLADIMGCSNRRFYDVYGAIVKGIMSDEPDAYEAYVKVATAIGDHAKANHKCRQTSEDALEIWIAAKRAGPGFAKILTQVSAAVEGTMGKEGPLKKMYRMVEKSGLRTENSGGLGDDGSLVINWRFGKVCDIRRGFIECTNFDQLRGVLEALKQAEDDGLIVIVRIKNRFTNPSAGGWADCMVNFYMAADPAQHICELQCVHKDLMLARKNLGGHVIYGKGRAAAELLELATAVVPKKWHTRIALLCLREYVQMMGNEFFLDRKNAGGFESWGSSDPPAKWANVQKSLTSRDDGTDAADILGTVLVNLRDPDLAVIRATFAFVRMTATTLNFSDVDGEITDKHVQCAAEFGTNVEHLKMTVNFNVSATDDAFAAMVTKMPNLKTINFAQLRGPKDKTFIAMLRHCKSLDFATFTGYGDGGPSGDERGLHRAMQVLHDVLKEGKQPDSINLSARGLSDGATYMTSYGLLELAKCCPNLTSLDIAGCQNIDNNILKLAELCPNLRNFNSCDQSTYGSEAGVEKLKGLLPDCTFTLESHVEPEVY